MDWLGRWFRRAAGVGLLLSLVPLMLWAVPAIHPAPRVRPVWTDRGGDQVTQWVTRKGFDRHGWVHQEQTLQWTAVRPATLDGVRAVYTPNTLGQVDLPPTESWKLQYHLYGNNHVQLPRGVELMNSGLLHTLPYSVMAIALATPAGLLGINRLLRRR